LKIQLKTTGIMSDYLPAEAIGGRIELDLPEAAEFSVIVSMLGIPDDERYVVSINDTLLPEPLHQPLQAGDKVIIMAPLAAG